MSTLLKATLGNEEWLKNNIDKIKQLFPETWTHVRNLNMLGISFQLKVIGIDWRSQEEFGKCMVFFEKSGILLRDGVLVKRSL